MLQTKSKALPLAPTAAVTLYSNKSLSRRVNKSELLQVNPNQGALNTTSVPLFCMQLFLLHNTSPKTNDLRPQPFIQMTILGVISLGWAQLASSSATLSWGHSCVCSQLPVSEVARLRIWLSEGTITGSFIIPETGLGFSCFPRVPDTQILFKHSLVS